MKKIILGAVAMISILGGQDAMATTLLDERFDFEYVISEIRLQEDGAGVVFLKENSTEYSGNELVVFMYRSDKEMDPYGLYSPALMPNRQEFYARNLETEVGVDTEIALEQGLEVGEEHNMSFYVTIWIKFADSFQQKSIAARKVSYASCAKDAGYQPGAICKLREQIGGVWHYDLYKDDIEAEDEDVGVGTDEEGVGVSDDGRETLREGQETGSKVEETQLDDGEIAHVYVVKNTDTDEIAATSVSEIGRKKIGEAPEENKEELEGFGSEIAMSVPGGSGGAAVLGTQATSGWKEFLANRELKRLLSLVVSGLALFWLIVLWKRRKNEEGEGAKESMSQRLRAMVRRNMYRLRKRW